MLYSYGRAENLTFLQFQPTHPMQSLERIRRALMELSIPAFLTARAQAQVGHTVLLQLRLLLKGFRHRFLHLAV